MTIQRLVLVDGRRAPDLMAPLKLLLRGGERVRPRNKVSVYVVELLQGSNLNTVDGVIQPGAQISRLRVWVRSIEFKGGTCTPEGKLASQASALVSPSVINAYSH
jgi:hypothetical protein